MKLFEWWKINPVKYCVRQLYKFHTSNLSIFSRRSLKELISWRWILAASPTVLYLASLVSGMREGAVTLGTSSNRCLLVTYTQRFHEYQFIWPTWLIKLVAKTTEKKGQPLINAKTTPLCFKFNNIYALKLNQEVVIYACPNQTLFPFREGDCKLP